MEEQDGYILTLEVPRERADEVMQAIREKIGIEPVQIERPGAPDAWIDIYFDDETRAMLVGKALPAELGVVASSVRTCGRRSWDTFWQHHFHCRAVGDRLLVCPVWEADAVREDERVRVVLEPGLSFGTGDHFTTRFCLEMIEKYAPATLLDIGTGSGVLAVAAAKLGYEEVWAVDHDESVLERTRRNACLNGVETQIRIFQHDIAGGWVEREFDVVCANLYASLLVTNAGTIAGAARRAVILSGVLEHEVDHVADAYLALGWREVVRDGDGEWAGLVFESPVR